MKAKCPYCDFENEVDLCDVEDNTIENFVCENCEEEFDVFIDYDPVLHSRKIEYIKCDCCGKKYKDLEINKKHFCQPWPVNTEFNNLCKRCFSKQEFEF